MLKLARMSRVCFRFFAFVLAIALLSGCAALRDAIFGREQHSAPKMDVKAEWWDGPRVRPGVVLIVQIGTTAVQPLTVSVMVDQKGEIMIPHLLQKPVPCNGLTLEELQDKLVKEYSLYYRQPQVSVTFAPYDGKGVSPWGTVTVLGEVLMPGPVNIPSTMNLSLTKAIQMAGGLKPFADRSSIQVTSCEKGGKQIQTKIDLDEIGKEGRADKDLVLRAGDVVWVPETWY